MENTWFDYDACEIKFVFLVVESLLYVFALGYLFSLKNQLSKNSHECVWVLFRVPNRIVRLGFNGGM